MRKEAKIKDSIKGFHWWLGALLLLLSACVTDYEPKGLEQVRDLLVVDGIITNGETTIKLRRSVGLTDDFTEDEFVIPAGHGTRWCCCTGCKQSAG